MVQVGIPLSDALSLVGIRHLLAFNDGGLLRYSGGSWRLIYLIAS